MDTGDTGVTGLTGPKKSFEKVLNLANWTGKADWDDRADWDRDQIQNKIIKLKVIKLIR